MHSSVVADAANKCRDDGLCGVQIDIGGINRLGRRLKAALPIVRHLLLSTRQAHFQYRICPLPSMPKVRIETSGRTSD